MIIVRLTVLVVLCLCLCRGIEKPARFFQQVYNHTFMHNNGHHKAWMALEEVDGLKNEDVVLLISGSAAKQFKYIRERYAGSLSDEHELVVV